MLSLLKYLFHFKGSRDSNDPPTPSLIVDAAVGEQICIPYTQKFTRRPSGSSRLIPDIDVCSFTDKNSGTTVSADAIIHVSQLSENQTISCVPLMMNMELAANLTSTSGIPVCDGDCVPDCKDNPQGEAYFPDKNDCTQFYQCSNGQLVSQSCSPATYWSTSKCTCVHFNEDICNKDTYRFLSPLLSIEKCTNASLA
ncbi:unnamed protein product [Mytilus edulis]|uniref:Chitin-binding type-2 domain-containing protein n=1 Tax=Mytilus edulis TaxID=6550 RepID=A0A8S3UFL7_MYTED|nr:unnamed protein product [Mytilus edulis]